jgi:hypothetical protein
MNPDRSMSGDHFQRDVTQGVGSMNRVCSARIPAGAAHCYFATRSQTKVLSMTGRLSSEESTRNDIRSVP